MIKHLVLGAALVSATGSLAHAGNGTNLTKFLPETTQAVVVMDAAAARNSKLLQESYQKLLDSKPDARTKLTELGVDPAKDIDTVMFSMGGAGELSKLGDGPVVVIVEGRFPIEKFKSQPGATKSTYKGVDVYTKDDGEGAFIDGRMFFAKKGQLAPTIDLVKGKGASLDKGKGGKAMRDAISGTNTKSHMWMTVLVPEKDRASMSAANVQADSFALTLTFASDVTVGVRLNAPTEASAASTVQMAQAALPQVKQMMSGIGMGAASNTLAVTQDKASLNATVKVTAAEIKTVTQLITSKFAGGGPAPANTNAPATTNKGGGMSGAKK